MPKPSVNHTRLAAFRLAPTPLFALDVQRAGIPGQPGASSLLADMASSRATGRRRQEPALARPGCPVAINGRRSVRHAPSTGPWGTPNGGVVEDGETSCGGGPWGP